jgi:hypothetical protein
MSKKNIVNFQELELGDIVKFIPYGSKKESYGVIYRLISNEDGLRKAGARVIEATIKGANFKIPEEDAGSYCKIPRVLSEFGAQAKRQMIYFSSNLRTLANLPSMTGQNEKDNIVKIGSLSSDQFLPLMFGHFEKLYAEGKLKLDGKPLLATHRREIQSRQVAHRIVLNDRISREDMLHRIQEEFVQSGGGLSLSNSFQESVNRLTIERCVDKGFLSERTAVFISSLALEKTGKAPRFFKDAVPLATTQKGRDQLAQIFGLTSRGKIFDSIVSEINDLAAALGLKPK